MVKILHLYHDLLNLYGEYGNIVVLCDALKKSNVDYIVDKLSIGDNFEFDDYDFIYCGSGTESKTELALKDFIKRKDSFMKAFSNNKHILFTGSSILLLGNNGISLFNYNVDKTDNRICGDVIFESPDYKDIVGYINTSYKISQNDLAYFKLLKSDITLKDYVGIGFKTNNLMTVNVTGPLLVKNPHLLKDLIIKLGGDSSLELNKHQYMSYEITLSELQKRFN